MNSERLSRARSVVWYRTRAASLRRDALQPCNLRARTVLLYSACRCEWLADRAEAAALGVDWYDAREPTVH